MAIDNVPEPPLELLLEDDEPPPLDDDDELLPEDELPLEDEPPLLMVPELELPSLPLLLLPPQPAAVSHESEANSSNGVLRIQSSYHPEWPAAALIASMVASAKMSRLGDLAFGTHVTLSEGLSRGRLPQISTLHLMEVK